MRKMARMVALAGALISVASCSSETATSAYIAERNKAVAEFGKADVDTATLDQRMADELKKLQTIMQAVVGPIHLEGFPQEGTYYVDTLTPELGYGKLDALAVHSADGKTLALVTTVPLLKDWLWQEPKKLDGGARSLAEQFEASFASEDFYTRAFSDDAHYYKYASLPVASADPAGKARAILFAAAQDYPAPHPPQGIAVAMVRGNDVIVLRKSIEVPTIPECEDDYHRNTADAEVALAAYQASKLADKAQFDEYLKLEEDANSHFLACYAQHLPGSEAYHALVQEAQALVDLAK